MVMIDPTRLGHIGRVKSRHLGAVSNLNEEYNALIRERNTAKAEIARLDQTTWQSRDPEQSAHHAQRLPAMKTQLANTEAAIIAMQAAMEQAGERASAAGGLHRRCEEFLQNKGRIIA
ncbi:hypothetical protein [Mesorhizobium sp. CO1-1-9]|uniref:hypothetical protein n=1 Tax=Mesorhizobium sp. CO1-1-9 TaxID=2876630 RepID=UPI001CCA456D|nr:hypothetical protein [Mesorhizobium sp. CO1-1-9]MBZ9695505.1 hypothetical protein [Mesorhizobium sp. CO1-1-9]